MLDGIYDITVRSQLGPRTGSLTIAYDHDFLCGKLQLLGFENRFSGGIVEGERIFIQMELHTPLGNRTITVDGFHREEELFGTVQIACQQIPFTAKKNVGKIAPAPF